MLEEKAKPKACAYIRVSTSSRAQENSFAFQSAYWDDYMKSQDQYEYIGLYADEGISAKTNKTRKQFMKMMEDARNGKIDKIFTKSLTRFGRNVVETITAIRELREYGVSVYFDTLKIDTMQENADFIIEILAASAEEELKQDSQNLKWAINNRYRKGAVYITNQTLGLRTINNKILVDNKQRWLVEKIFKLYLDGYGLETIARMLNEEHIPTATGKKEWRHTNIRNILTNEKYMGDSLQHKKYTTLDMKIVKNKGEVEQFYIVNNHEAIISKEDFKKVQDMLNEKRPSKLKLGVAAPTYPFSGKVRCGHDGDTFRRKFVGYKDKKKGVYKCSTYLMMTKKVCNNSAILESELENKFISAYNEYINHIKQDSTIDKLKEELRQKLDKERELKALYINGYLAREQYNKLSEEIINESNLLEKQIRKEQLAQREKYGEEEMTEFDATKVEKHLEKAIINDYTVTYEFIDGYKTTRSYSNGKSGNKKGYNRNTCENKVSDNQG